LSEGKIITIHQDCDKKLAEDTSLPNSAYLVVYETENTTKYDIVVAYKKSDVFDVYWDKYKTGLNSIEQTSGVMNPKLWKSNKNG